MFTGSRSFVINGGSFTSLQNDGRIGIDILRDAAIPEAAVDSEAREYELGCFPGTREQYIHDIMTWATSPDDTLPIYWMSGPAGVGKTAIAQTCAERLSEIDHLGAAFFFSINHRSDHKRFFTTLAYQLSVNLPEYRTLLNDIVSRDPTIVEKRMASQFHTLITKPLQDLQRRGQGIQRKTVFIDGLDECGDKTAQCRIIELIASSVCAGSTSLRWAIFSRAEYHIVATFDNPELVAHCHRASLPISRGDDGDIRLYIETEVKNILRLRRLPPSSLPSEADITALVDASEGLFAYPAAILRHISKLPFLQLDKALQDVFDAASEWRTHQADFNHPAPFAELDALYTVIMGRIPKDVLSNALLLLAWMVESTLRLYDVAGYNVIVSCNEIGLTEAVFRGVCEHLHAVLYLRLPQRSLELPVSIDTTRSYFTQISDSSDDFEISNRIRNVYGRIHFHHKSFFDFLTDPARSSTFCVTTPAMRQKLFERLLRVHLSCAESYAVNGQDLELAPNVPSSSVSLAWPYGVEFVDSAIKMLVFGKITHSLSHDNPCPFLGDLPSEFLQQLAELDYRKYLYSDRMLYGTGHMTDFNVVGCFGVRGWLTNGHTFRCLQRPSFDEFDAENFLKMVTTYEGLSVIHWQPCPASVAPTGNPRFDPHPQPTLSLESAHGLYQLGHDDKSAIWYWEFDMVNGYYQEFWTINLEAAIQTYKSKDFRAWVDAIDKEDVEQDVPMN